MQPESMTTSTQAPLYYTRATPSPANTVVPPMTLPQPSACNSRGPWNGCSRLPLQPPPLSLSAACPGESCHQCSPGGSAHSIWRNRISPQTRGDGLSHPCPDSNPHTDISCGWPHQVTPPASFMLLTHCSSPLCTEDTRGGLHVHVPPRTVPVAPCWISFFCYRRKLTQP